MFFVACLGGCTALAGWSLYLLLLPPVALFLLVKDKAWGYLGYASLKMIITLISQNPPSGQFSLQGGLILAFSFFGGCLALLVGLFIHAETGDQSLRRIVTSLMDDYALLYERIVDARYFHEPEEGEAKGGCGCGCTCRTGSGAGAGTETGSPTVCPSTAIELAEAFLSKRAFVDTQLPLRAVALENMAHAGAVVPLDSVRVVRAVQTIWRCIWTLHHLLAPVSSESRDAAARHEQTTIANLNSARGRLNLDRLLGTAFALLFAQLDARRYRSGPVLRPVAAEPSLLAELLNDYVAACLLDHDFVQVVLASSSTRILSHCLLLFDTWIDCSHALTTIFDYAECYQRTLKFAKRLRAADLAVFERRRGRHGRALHRADVHLDV